MRQHSLQASVVRESAATPSHLVRPEITRMLWLFIAAMFLTVFVSFGLLQLRIEPRSNPTLLSASAAYALIACFYTYIRRDALVATAMITVGQLFIILFLGLLLTYAASASALAFRDAELHALDQWMGFDRQSYQDFVASVPGLSDLLDVAYWSIQPETVLVPLVLIMTGRLPNLQRFALAYGLAVSATALIAVFVPAMDALIHVDLAPLRQAAIPPGVYSHIVTLEALRSGEMSVIRLDNLEGLLTFPSFHTANAILFAWVLWNVHALRVVGVIVNGLMICSTPINGQHYFVDLLAGGLVAFAAILVANRLTISANSPTPRSRLSAERNC